MSSFDNSALISRENGMEERINEACNTILSNGSLVSRSIDLKSMNRQELHFNLATIGIVVPTYHRLFQKSTGELMEQMSLYIQNYGTGENYTDRVASQITAIYRRCNKDKPVVSILYGSNASKNMAELIRRLHGMLDSYGEQPKQLIEVGELDYRGALTLSSTHYIKVYAYQNKVFILTNKLTNELFLRIGAILPAILSDLPRDQIPLDLFDARVDAQEYVEKLCATTGALEKIRETWRKKEQLRNATQAIERYMLEVPKRKLENTQERIDDSEETIRSLYKQRRELQLLLIGIGTDKDNILVRIKELNEFLLDIDYKNINKLTTNTSGDNLCLDIMMNTTMLYWDETLFDVLLRNAEYNDLCRFTKEELEVIKDVFVTRKVTLHMLTSIRWVPETGEIMHNSNMYTNRSGNAYEENNLKHPHIHFYNCWGDNKPHIARASIAGNYIEAYMQIKATLSGINFADGAVTTKFFYNQLDNYKNTLPCFSFADDPDCTRYTMKQIIKKKQEIQAQVAEPTVVPVAPVDLELHDTTGGQATAQPEQTDTPIEDILTAI